VQGRAAGFAGAACAERAHATLMMSKAAAGGTIGRIDENMADYNAPSTPNQRRRTKTKKNYFVLSVDISFSSY
jgi:hypothetical protein